MQPGRVMPMNDERITGSGIRSRRGFRGLIEAPLSGVFGKRLGGLVSALGALSLAYRDLLALRMKRNGVGAYCLPCVAVANHLVDGRVKVELSLFGEPLQLFPVERHRHRRSIPAADAVGGHDGLICPIAMNVDEGLALP